MKHCAQIYIINNCKLVWVSWIRIHSFLSKLFESVIYTFKLTILERYKSASRKKNLLKLTKLKVWGKSVLSLCIKIKACGWICLWASFLQLRADWAVRLFSSQGSPRVSRCPWWTLSCCWTDSPQDGPLCQVPLTSEAGPGSAGLSSSNGWKTGQPPSAELAGSCDERLGSTPQPETGQRHKESQSGGWG